METTLRIDKEDNELLKELMKDTDIKTQKEYVHAMVTYFKETGINPKEKNRSTAEELSKLRNTVISFIREQEKKKLDPIILKVTEVMEFLKEYFQKDAVTKEDIIGLLQQSKPKTTIVEPIYTPPTTVREEEDEKLRKFTAHVKSLFSEFTSYFKASAFGGYTIEKSVLDRFKSQFNKL